jgi:tol-pal system protein YbgF
MTIRLTTTRAAFALALALLYVGLTPAAPAAADREHQQILADLRMLQEQTQQLQGLLNGLGDALKAINSRIDDQTSLERKAFADRKVQMDTISGDIRIVREKVDETNVRLSSLSQELEAMRDAMPEPGQPAPPVSDATLPDRTPAPPTPATAPPQTNPGGISPTRLFETSRADYMSGEYSLAIRGFESYLKTFPKGVQAAEAQLMIGDSYRLDGKDAEAVIAYERVITDYAGSPMLAQAYYKRGLSLEKLGEVERAKQSYELVVKQFPASPEADLARQRLTALNQPKR